MLLNEPGFSLASLTSSLYCGCTGGGGWWQAAAAVAPVAPSRLGVRPSPGLYCAALLLRTQHSIAAPTSHYKLCCGCSSLFFYLDSSLDAAASVAAAAARRYGASVSLPEPAVIVADANGELLVPRKN